MDANSRWKSERRPVVGRAAAAGLVALLTVLLIGIYAGADGDSSNLPSADDWRFSGADPQGTSAVGGEVGEQPDILWREDLEAHAKTSSIANGILVTGLGSSTNELVARNATSGEELWRFEGGSNPHGSDSAGFKSDPAIADGTVFAPNEASRTVFAVDLETGVERWSFEAEDEVVASPVVVDGKVYVGSHDGNVYALDAQTGDLVWSAPTPGRVKSTLVTDGQRVFAAPTSPELFAFDIDTGEQVWRQSFPSRVFGLAYDEGSLLLGDGTGRVYAVDADTGDQRWVTDIGGSRAVPGAVTESHVYVGGPQVVSIDRETQQTEWSWAPGGRTRGPIIVGGDLVVPEHKGSRLWVLERASGEVRWKYVFEGMDVSDLGYAEGLLHIDGAGPSGGAHVAIGSADQGSATGACETTERIENLTIDVEIRRSTDGGDGRASISLSNPEATLERLSLSLDGASISVGPDGSLQLGSLEPGQHVLTARYGGQWASETFEIAAEGTSPVPSLGVLGLLSTLAGLACACRWAKLRD